MSVQPVPGARAIASVVSASAVDARSEVAAPGVGSAGVTAGSDDCLEFVRFCYRRRRVAWPALYDEMSAVAARGAFRGMGYAELAERGVSFCLNDMPRLVALVERVIREEQPLAEPLPVSISLSPATA